MSRLIDRPAAVEGRRLRRRHPSVRRHAPRGRRQAPDRRHPRRRRRRPDPAALGHSRPPVTAQPHRPRAARRAPSRRAPAAPAAGRGRRRDRHRRAVPRTARAARHARRPVRAGRWLRPGRRRRPGDRPARRRRHPATSCAAAHSAAAGAGGTPPRHPTARRGAGSQTHRPPDDGPGLRPPAPTGAYRPTARAAPLHPRPRPHCRMPGCRRAPGRCDIDHGIAHADGGPTDCWNLCCLCRRHHRIKTFARGWHFELLADGRLIVRTPSGVSRDHPAARLVLRSRTRPTVARRGGATRPAPLLSAG